MLSGSERKGYLNWDIAEDRERIIKHELPPTDIWVFDELHKYKSWRNYLKGLHDQRVKQTHPPKILVTGSARLDWYRRGGDSLQGRYHYLRLHPLSLAELKIDTTSSMEALLQFGGFPEPFFGESEDEARRWSREYRSRLIREDLQSLERIHDVGNLEHLMLRLPTLVGSPLSINALHEDLQVSHKAVCNWLNILERLYAIYRIPPFGAPILRAVKKEQKHYHFDWSLVPQPGFRFENLVAGHLLKWVNFLEDTKGRDMELRYFRDVDRREVDFIVTENGIPTHAIECKLGDDPVNPGLRYFHDRFPKCEAWQISCRGTKDYVTPDGIRVAPAIVLLKQFT